MIRSLIAALLILGSSLSSSIAVGEPTSNSKPKVLIIGDSISIGYTNHVKKLLDKDFEVIHNKGNAQHTGTGLTRLDAWLGDTKWDVIHFNWGLWDLCYRNPEAKTQGRRDKENGKITIPIEKYEENLDKLVTRLKKTNAKLIWAHTTVVPENEMGRFVDDAKKYNEAAARVMKKHNIPINDLYSLTKEYPASLFVGPGNVHYTKKGSEKLAVQVADKIRDVYNDGSSGK